MSVSLLFSFFIYENVNRDFRRFERMEEISDEREGSGLPPFHTRRTRPMINPVLVAQARSHLLTSLGIVNLVIIGGSALAGYFLAGRTLQPIQEMVAGLNRFVSDASHELRTPLTSLRSEIEVGLRNKKLTLTEARTLITSNLEDVVRLQALSNDLLTLTQYEKITNVKTFEKLSLEEIIHRAVKITQGLAKNKHIAIHVNIGGVMLQGSRQQLEELFTILLDNAIKYSHPKGVVTLTGTTDHHKVNVFVSDRGIGIDKKVIPFIFDRFYRADTSRSKQTDGFGLGLSIAKKIVDIHKGSIEIESTLRQGSTVTVKLPLPK